MKIKEHLLLASSILLLSLPLSGITSPSAAETLSDKESLEKMGVAFASLIWLPRLDAACALYKKGLIREDQLSDAYRILYKDLASNSVNKPAERTFTIMMALLEAGPEALSEYMDADSNDVNDSFFEGCPLPNKALGY